MKQEANLVASATQTLVARAIAGLTGTEKHRAHNRELHELAQMRRYGGYQMDMFAR